MGKGKRERGIEQTVIGSEGKKKIKAMPSLKELRV